MVWWMSPFLVWSLLNFILSQLEKIDADGEQTFCIFFYTHHIQHGFSLGNRTVKRFYAKLDSSSLVNITWNCGFHSSLEKDCIFNSYIQFHQIKTVYLININFTESLFVSRRFQCSCSFFFLDWFKRIWEWSMFPGLIIWTQINSTQRKGEE